MCVEQRERKRQTDRERRQGREPEGGWGRRGRRKATCCETSKSKLSPTLFDLSPPHKPHHHIIVPVCHMSTWISEENEIRKNSTSLRTEFGFWRYISSFYSFTWLHLFLPLSVALSFALFSLSHHPFNSLLEMVVKRRCLKMISVK